MSLEGRRVSVDESEKATPSTPSMLVSLALLGVGVILAAAGLGVVAVASGTVGDRSDGVPSVSAPAAAPVKFDNDGFVEALAVPSNMVGSWEGNLIDPVTGGDLGPMTVLIRPGQIGDEVAFTTYPGYDCDGTATLRAGGPNVRVFEEVDVDATGETCVDAEIEFSVAPDGTLSVTTCLTDRRTCESEGGTQTGALRRVG